MHTPFFNTLRLYKIKMLQIQPSNVTMRHSLFNSQVQCCSIKWVSESFTLRGDFTYYIGLKKKGNSPGTNTAMTVKLFVDFMEAPLAMCEYIGDNMSPYLFSQVKHTRDNIYVVNQLLSHIYDYCKKTGLGGL